MLQYGTDFKKPKYSWINWRSRTLGATDGYRTTLISEENIDHADLDIL